MEIYNFKLFDESSLERIRLFVDELVWEDGRNTAAGYAKEIKSNEQALPERNPEAIKYIAAEMSGHAGIQNTCFPEFFPRIFFNRYTGTKDSEATSYYKLHADKALMQQRRTDFSFTIFLEEPDKYEGGELVIHVKGREVPIKLGRGEICLYASGLLHEVRPVTSGTRLCVVGWMSSCLKLPADREIMVQLRNYSNWLKTEKGLEYDDTLKLMEIEQNLIRRFA